MKNIGNIERDAGVAVEAASDGILAVRRLRETLEACPKFETRPG